MPKKKTSPYAGLTPRGKTMRYTSRHRGETEQPPGSNTDEREFGIRRAQIDCANGGNWLVGTPWCGEHCFDALQSAGVKGLTSRLASVALIEQDARACRAPFKAWVPPSGWRHVLRGDLVVLFGPGVHVEIVRSIKVVHGKVFLITEGGNTSSGNAGSQSNGGGRFRRVRPLSDVRGFAIVNYPGGKITRAADRLAAKSSRVSRRELADASVSAHRNLVASDELLATVLQDQPKDGNATEFYCELRAALR